MEIAVFPASFGVAPGKAVTPTGEIDVVRLQFADIGGTVVVVTFGAQDWRQFVEACKDPEAAAVAAKARANLVVAQRLMKPPKGNGG